MNFFAKLLEFLSKPSTETNVSVPPDVHFGVDGWMFIVGGTNQPLNYYTEPYASDELCSAWHKLLHARYDRFQARGIRYFHLIAPNKLSVYPENCTLEMSCFEQHPINALMHAVKGQPDYMESVINPIPYFMEKKMQNMLYWKTDSHWTYQGCFAAYELVCEKLGLKPVTDLLERSYVEGKIGMDLGSKLTPPITEKVRFYNTYKDAERFFANELVLFKENNDRENDGGLHVGSHVIYRNDQANNSLRVVMFGDSFSDYRPCLLAGMLAETVSELHFIWSTSIDYDYVWSVNPDVVLTEIVERFMPTVPGDNLNLESYVAEKLEKHGIC